jgi:hypothetical protein
LNDQVKKNEMSGAYSTNGGEGECIYDIGEKARRPRDRWADNIKVDLRVIGLDGVDWIDMAQDRDQWRALVSTVLNLRVP